MLSTWQNDKTMFHPQQTNKGTKSNVGNARSLHDHAWQVAGGDALCDGCVVSSGSKLLGVLNHFYKDVPGEWVCLKFTRKSLAIAGVDVVFEEPAPVGDTPAIDSGGQLFPHLMGGIPTATGVVLDELPILRAPGGGFQSIPGVTEPRESDSVGQSAPQHQRIWAGSVAASFWCGLAVGAALTVGLCVMADLTPSLLGKFNSKR
eukprot:g67923.t1